MTDPTPAPPGTGKTKPTGDLRQDGVSGLKRALRGTASAVPGAKPIRWQWWLGGAFLSLGLWSLLAMALR